MPDAVSTRRPVSVLVVEDDRLMRRMMVETLREEGLEAMGLEGGAEALETLRTSPGIALVISDINMPRMSGLELARRVLTEFPAVRLLVVSGREHLHPDLLPASTAYLQKPFSVRAFLMSVKAILRA